jgi:hypothetical protein
MESLIGPALVELNGILFQPAEDVRDAEKYGRRLNVLNQPADAIFGHRISIGTRILTIFLRKCFHY